MVSIPLAAKVQGIFTVYSQDVSIKEGIAVDDDNYNAGAFLDRDYDVRGFAGFSIILENIHPSNGFTYAIQEATKDFDDISELADADYTSHADHTDVNVASGAKSTPYKLVRLTPEFTAVRLQAKREISPNDSEVRGDIRGF